MDILKVWKATTLQPFELHGSTEPFWQPQNKFYLKLRLQGRERSFVMCQALMSSFTT